MLGSPPRRLRPSTSFTSAALLLHSYGAWVLNGGLWHARNWFVVEGAPGRVCTRLGTRPGDPVADIIFCWAFLVFQKHLFDELMADELVPAVPSQGQAQFPARRRC